MTGVQTCALPIYAMADDNFGQFSEMRTFFDLAKNDIGYVVIVGTPA